MIGLLHDQLIKIIKSNYTCSVKIKHTIKCTTKQNIGAIVKYTNLYRRDNTNELLNRECKE